MNPRVDIVQKKKIYIYISLAAGSEEFGRAPPSLKYCKYADVQSLDLRVSCGNTDL